MKQDGLKISFSYKNRNGLHRLKQFRHKCKIKWIGVFFLFYLLNSNIYGQNTDYCLKFEFHTPLDVKRFTLTFDGVDEASSSALNPTSCETQLSYIPKIIEFSAIMTDGSNIDQTISNSVGGSFSVSINYNGSQMYTHYLTVTQYNPLRLSISPNQSNDNKVNHTLQVSSNMSNESDVTHSQYLIFNSPPINITSTGAASSSTITASKLPNYPNILDNYISFSYLDTDPCGYNSSNMITTMFYGEPALKIQKNGLVCEDEVIPLDCYFANDAESISLAIGASIEYTTDLTTIVGKEASTIYHSIPNFTVGVNTSLTFAQFNSDPSLLGIPIKIRPCKTYIGYSGSKTFYGDPQTIVFLPKITGIGLTPNPAKCAEDNAGFTLHFDGVPNNGSKDPNNAPVPLIISIYQYTSTRLAGEDESLYKTFNYKGKTYYYKDGATAMSAMLKNGNSIESKDIFEKTSNFQISSGLYVVTANEQSTTANCGISETLEFNPPLPFSATSSAVKLPNSNFNAITGSSDATVEFTFTGGTSPYSVIASDGTTTSYDVSSVSYLESVNEAQTVKTYNISDKYNCIGSGSETVELFRPPDLQLTATTQNVSCNNKNTGTNDDGEIYLTVKGGVSPYTVQLIKDNQEFCSNPDISGGSYTFSNKCKITTGSYTLKVTDALGGSETTVCTVGQPDRLILTLNPTNPLCSYSKGLLSFSASGGIVDGGGYSYLMNNTSVSESIQTVDAGVYSVTLSDRNSCSVTETIEIVSPPVLALSIQNSKPASCYNVANGAALATVSNPNGDITFWNSIGNEIYPNNGNEANEFIISDLAYSPLMLITVKDGAGCEATATAIIPLKNPAISVQATTTGQAPCSGKDGIVQLTVADGELGSGNYTFSILGLENTSITSSASASFTLTGGYSHTFKVTDGAGCTASVDATVEVVANPIKVSVQDIVGAWCSSSATGQFTAVASPGAVSYQLVGLGLSQASGNFSSLTPESYRVLATDQFGCSDNIQVTVPIKDESLSIQAINWQPAACELSSPTGSIKVNRSMFNSTKTGAGNISYSLGAETGSGDAYTFSALTSGNYTVMAKDAEGCTQSSNVTVTYDSNPVEVFSTVTEQTCTQLENAKITLAASTKPENLKLFKFTFEQTASDWTSNQISYAVKKAGIYSFKVTDQNNCTVNHTETVENLNYAPKPQFISEIQAACWQATNGVLSVRNIPNNSYPDYRYWINIDTIFTHSSTDAAIFKGLSRGKYTVYVKDELGCQDTTSFIIGLQTDSVKISTIQTTPATCIAAKNGKAHFTVKSFDAANLYHLKYYTPQNTLNGSTDFEGETANFIHIPVLKTNHYTAVVTDQYGCTDQQVFYINVQQDTLNLEFSRSKDATCPGASNAWLELKRSFGQGNFQYQLSSNLLYTRAFEESAGVVPILNLPAGNYTVLVKDTNQCLASVSNILINQPDTIQFLSLSNNYIREKGQATGQISATIWKGNGQYIYEWYKLPEQLLLNSGKTADTTNIKQLLAGQYLIRVQDTAKCFVGRTGWLEKKFTIAEPDSALSVKVIKNKAVSCNGLADGQLALQAHGGWGNAYTYGLDAVHTSVNNEFNGLKTGGYAVFVKDSVGVIYSSSVSITQPEPLSISFKSKKDANCFQSADGSILVDLSGGNFPYYSISKNQTDWVKGNQLTGLNKANYTVYARDTLGCSSQLLTTINIDEPNELTATAVIDSSRCHSYNGSIESLIQGGIPSYSYRWKNDSGMVMPSQTSGLAQIRSGIYRLNVTDAHVCSKEFTFYVPDITDLTVSNISETDVSCWGYTDGSARLTITKGNPPYTVTWPDNSESESINGLSAGSYRAMVFDSQGCKVFPTIEIGTPSRIRIASITTTEPYCEGVEDGKLAVESMGGFGNYTYLWSSGKKDSTISKLNAGIYGLNIRDDHQCSMDTTFKLAYQQPIKPSLGYDRNLCLGNSLEITPGFYTSYKWNSNIGLTSTEPSITVNSAGKYNVEVTDQLGCIGRDTIKIGVSTTAMEGKLLVATEVSQNDTVVAFQASWPMPDSVSYSFEGAKIIDIGQYYRKVVYADTGAYRIVMKSYLNDCEDQSVKTIHVDVSKTTHKKSAQRNILSYRVSPNPNSGQFYVDVQLGKSAPISLRLANLATGIMSDIRNFEGSSTYYLPYNINVQGGSYVLYLQCGNEIRSITLIIIR